MRLNRCICGRVTSRETISRKLTVRWSQIDNYLRQSCVHLRYLRAIAGL
jgi:hypothetical protein